MFKSCVIGVCTNQISLSFRCPSKISWQICTYMLTVEILKNYNKERDSSDFRKHVEVGWLGAVYWGISFLTTELWRSYIMVTSVTSSVSTPLFCDYDSTRTEETGLSTRMLTVKGDQLSYHLISFGRFQKVSKILCMDFD